MAALAGARLAGAGPTGWWFHPRIPPDLAGNRVVFYLGLVLSSAAWLGIGRGLSTGHLPEDLRRLWLLGGVWAAPLVAGPALFSHDVYSYLAQGEILHLGLNPYHHAPLVLSHLGQPRLLAAVSPFWRATTAPYGPLFLGAAALIVALTGSKLIAGVLLLRLLDLLGLILLGVFVPRLARSLGADPRRAFWLAALSPLTLLELIAAGHNDVLMVGLMVAGVALSVEGRPLPGVALCALAATVKLPALLAVAFIAASWAWASAGRLKPLAQCALVTAAVGVVVGVVSGTGFSWISPSLVSTPQKVHLAITPGTAVGWTIGAILHALDVSANARQLEAAGGTVTLVLALLVAVVLLWRTRATTMVRDLGIVLLVLALGGPAAWPWYLTWGVAMLAALPGWQRAGALTAGAVLSVFLVKPDGILALPLQSAPAVLAVYAGLTALGWHARQRHRRASAGRPVVAPASRSDPSALVESR
jgi:alpha-1,6-mannosyltransferase